MFPAVNSAVSITDVHLSAALFKIPVKADRSWSTFIQTMLPSSPSVKEVHHRGARALVLIRSLLLKPCIQTAYKSVISIH